MDNLHLLNEAVSAMEHAYSPYSGFKVGAALLCENGKVFTGCNVENVSFGATVCAERVAACKAVSEGEHRFKAIAIVSSSGKETFPCGICRQFLSEFSPNIVIILQDKRGIHEYKLSELFAHSFSEFSTS